MFNPPPLSAIGVLLSNFFVAKKNEIIAPGLKAVDPEKSTFAYVAAVARPDTK